MAIVVYDVIIWGWYLEHETVSSSIAKFLIVWFYICCKENFYFDHFSVFFFLFIAVTIVFYCIVL